MLDIKFIRENPDAVKENIRKKFQNAKLPLVDEVIALDAEKRAAENEGNDLRAQRNKLSKQVGMLMGQAKKDPSKLEEAEAVKAQVKADADRLAQLEEMEEKLSQQIHHILLVIPQMIDPSVPIGKDDSCNVEVERFGEATVPAFDIPYHTDIMERFDGIDLDAAGRVSGNGFYYLMGDIARLHEAVLAYGRDFMISKGFTYCIPPFMIHGNVVVGDGEVGHLGLTKALDLHVGGVVRADGHRGVNDLGNLEHDVVDLLVQLGLQLLKGCQPLGLIRDLLLHSLGLRQLAGVLLGLTHQYTHLLAQVVAVGAELVRLLNVGAALFVQRNDLVHHRQLLVLEFFLDVFLHQLRIFPDKLDVQHTSFLLKLRLNDFIDDLKWLPSVQDTAAPGW